MATLNNHVFVGVDSVYRSITKDVPPGGYSYGISFSNVNGVWRWDIGFNGVGHGKDPLIQYAWDQAVDTMLSNLNAPGSFFGSTFREFQSFYNYLESVLVVTGWPSTDGVFFRWESDVEGTNRLSLQVDREAFPITELWWFPRSCSERNDHVVSSQIWERSWELSEQLQHSKYGG